MQRAKCRVGKLPPLLGWQMQDLGISRRRLTSVQRRRGGDGWLRRLVCVVSDSKGELSPRADTMVPKRLAPAVDEIARECCTMTCAGVEPVSPSATISPASLQEDKAGILNLDSSRHVGESSGRAGRTGHNRADTPRLRAHGGAEWWGISARGGINLINHSGPRLQSTPTTMTTTVDCRSFTRNRYRYIYPVPLPPP
jgi:hypothetical protein